jgi:hypothetical protein
MLLADYTDKSHIAAVRRPTFLSRLIITSRSTRKTGFDPRQVCVGFVVDAVRMENILFQVLQLLPISKFPPMLHTYVAFICQT